MPSREDAQLSHTSEGKDGYQVAIASMISVRADSVIVLAPWARSRLLRRRRLAVVVKAAVGSLRLMRPSGSSDERFSDVRTRIWHAIGAIAAFALASFVGMIALGLASCPLDRSCPAAADFIVVGGLTVLAATAAVAGIGLLAYAVVPSTQARRRTMRTVNVLAILTLILGILGLVYALISQLR